MMDGESGEQVEDEFKKCDIIRKVTDARLTESCFQR